MDSEYTSVSLCNTALELIGANGITDFYTDSTEAAKARVYYPLAKKSFLQSHSWAFATRQESLISGLNDKTAFPEYKYRYGLPNDFIKLVGRSNPTLRYQKMNSYIYTNALKMYATFIYNIEEASFPPLFAEALMLKLAIFFATAITEDENKANMLEHKFKMISNEAKAANLNENLYQSIPQGKFNLVTIRN